MYEILEKLLKQHGITAYRLAQETGISTATLTSWKQGKYVPKDEKLQKIADYFNVSLDYLRGKFKDIDDNTDLELLKQQIDDTKRGVRINVLGEVAAGIPIEAIENIVDVEEITPELAKTGKFFGLKIKGNSMEPRIIEGDTVIVRQQDDAESGDVVIVMVNGDSATCKRLMKYKDGISLISFNPAYQPMNYSSKDIEEKPIRIIGKVVENRQKY